METEQPVPVNWAKHLVPADVTYFPEEVYRAFIAVTAWAKTATTAARVLGSEYHSNRDQSKQYGEPDDAHALFPLCKWSQAGVQENSSCIV